MKILIAGSRGMVGSAVTSHLIESGQEVIRLVRREGAMGGSHAKHFEKTTWNEYRRAGWENHPFYAASIGWSHTGPSDKGGSICCIKETLMAPLWQ